MIDLNDWEFIASNGLELIGKRSSDRTLSPVLQLIRTFVPTQQGVGMGLQLLPFLGVGISKLTVPEGALRVSMAAFAVGTSRNWMQLIENGIEIEARWPVRHEFGRHRG